MTELLGMFAALLLWVGGSMALVILALGTTGDWGLVSLGMMGVGGILLWLIGGEERACRPAPLTPSGAEVGKLG